MLGWSALTCCLLAAGGDKTEALPVIEPCSVRCIEELVRMSRDELEELYRHAEPGPIPHGFTRGKAIRWAGTKLAVPNSRATGALWHGKIFDDCMLVNKWCCGFEAIHARVYYGPSWLDGQESIIMDYRGTSRVWADVRDEIRQVAPGIYLGVMYLRRCPCPKFKMFFALDAGCCCQE